MEMQLSQQAAGHLFSESVDSVSRATTLRREYRPLQMPSLLGMPYQLPRCPGLSLLP